MMRSFFTLLILSFGLLANAQVKKTPAAAAPQKAPAAERNISITLTPLKNCKVYIGCFFGNGKALVDSTMLDDKSHGVFKGPKLTGGIYFIVTPQLTIPFDFLMDSKQQFSIVGDTAMKDKAAITGSAENDLYKSYASVAGVSGARLAQLDHDYATAKTKEEKDRIVKESVALNKSFQQYKDSLARKNPGSLLAMLLNTMKYPQVPAIPVVNGKRDSTYPFRYVKEHYWDDVLFNDDRLLRTPFFEKKVDTFFKNFVSPVPDSIIEEVKYMLLSARTGKEIYPYLLTKFTNKYMNPEYMGQDKVFLYLFENFYAKGDTTLLNQASRKIITDRAYSIMANQLGQPAPELNLTDTLGKNVSLYSLNGPFTLVIFWDPNCGHCKEEVPKYDSIYRAKWKALGLKIYSVNIYENEIPAWKRFIKEKELSDTWVQAYETKEAKTETEKSGRPNFRQLYDIFKTPTVYLLDKDKHILAKQLSMQQFDELIDTKLKSGSK